MNWKFWKKEYEPSYTIETASIPTSTLLRWFLYDSAVKTPNKYAEAFGFNPISAEGEEMEIRESKERLEQLEPYIDFISMMAGINGKVLTRTFSEALQALGIMSDAEGSDEELELMEELYTSIAVSCLVPTLSVALHLGILVNPGTTTEASHYE